MKPVMHWIKKRSRTKQKYWKMEHFWAYNKNFTEIMGPFELIQFPMHPMKEMISTTAPTVVQRPAADIAFKFMF